MLSPLRNTEPASPAPLSSVYEDVWKNTSYRRFSPGEQHIEAALSALNAPRGASFIDFGCGTGRPANELQKRGFSVVGVDFAANCLDASVDVPLIVADLCELNGLSASFGFCTDVMEHVAPEDVDRVLLNICESCKNGVFFAISVVADAFGPALIGKPLHLTIQNAEWWRQKLEQFWPRVEILCDNRVCVTAACFTFPPKFRANVVVDALCNTATDALLNNVEINSRRDLPWLAPVDHHEGHAVLVGGGPSLARHLDEIRQRAANGQVIFALNGAATYLKSNDIPVDYQLVLDARPENIRFVADKPALSYLIGSQVHPSLLDALADEDVVLFHYGMEGLKERLPKGKMATLLGGGHVLGPIAMCAVFTLGFRQLHLYGYDSSDGESGAAHAYEQRETTAEEKRIDVKFGDKIYRCSFGMYKQAEQFPHLAQMLADEGCTITVHGDGLLPAMARDMSSQPATPATQGADCHGTSQ